jgi:hypothetical protein
VIQTVLFEGRNRVRVYQPEGEPPPGFDRVEATLEDAYLATVRLGNGALRGFEGAA